VHRLYRASHSNNSFLRDANVLVLLRAMESSVPEEFRPQEERSDGDDGEEIAGLFAQDDSDTDEDDGMFQDVTLADSTYKLKLAPSTGTLFCDQVWSGSKLLAEFLALNAQTYVTGKRTIELGAGTALPSLVALSHDSSFSLITDFPDKQLLQAIRETVGWNWSACSCPKDRVAVLGHEWGTSVDDLLKVASSSQLASDDADTYFDLAILSECLWKHRCHAALAKSLDEVLHPSRGVAVLTYAHHIPGKEREDDAFFDICEAEYGLKVAMKIPNQVEYQWDNEKSITEFLVVLRRVGVNNDF
jgi:predicted nicotinamide N-methyase